MSTKEGAELLGFVREVKKFCVQLADLLMAADELMTADGWELATSQNIAYAEPSTSPLKPKQWFLNEAFRFYRKADEPRIYTMISILLDGYSEGGYELKEPLITAGWLQRASDSSPSLIGSETLWYRRAHGYAPLGTSYGSVVTLESRKKWPEEYVAHPRWHQFDRVDTFAAPLVRMSSTEALAEQIVNPLLKMVTPLLAVQPT